MIAKNINFPLCYTGYCSKRLTRFCKHSSTCLKRESVSFLLISSYPLIWSVDPMICCNCTVRHRILKHYSTHSEVMVENRAYVEKHFLLKMTPIITPQSLAHLMTKILYKFQSKLNILMCFQVPFDALLPDFLLLHISVHF
jgi:hypothetical protein